MALTWNICRHCGGQVFGGWAGGRLLQQLVTCDAQTLTPTQELAAAVAGCRTWTLHAAGELHPRDARKIRLRPAGTQPRQTVHATHVCTPTPWRTGP